MPNTETGASVLLRLQQGRNLARFGPARGGGPVLFTGILASRPPSMPRSTDHQELLPGGKYVVEGKLGEGGIGVG